MKRVALVLAAFLAVSGLGACSGGGGGSYTVTAYFPSAISLYGDSQVRVLGLRAGRVRSVKVIGTKVRVVMSIHDDIPLPKNASATIIPLSFIGERYVQFYPAWKQGEPKLEHGAVLDLDRTSVPVEPDETLAALKHLLDTIDPQATSQLVHNLALGLDGTGEDLNKAIAGLGTITETLGEKDKQVAAIIDNFDRFTATLAGRDQTLGRVLDTFARTTDALAQERTALQSLLSSLASLSTNGLDLLKEHGGRLDKDITVLSRELRLVGVHIDQVDKLLAAGPVLVAGKDLNGKQGLAAAYDKNLHAIDLRALVTPNVAQVFNALGLPTTLVCEPVTTQCQIPGTPVFTPDLPNIQPLPSGTAKKKSNVGGLIRSISSVFG
ncbi:MAG: phospholipid/cholesterol/gamma-HCH transport system substrate-binding protein [Actinomycetota bacterium]